MGLFSNKLSRLVSFSNFGPLANNKDNDQSTRYSTARSSAGFATHGTKKVEGKTVYIAYNANLEIVVNSVVKTPVLTTQTADH